MKVLIQDAQSRLFLDAQGRWTNNPTHADDFVVTTIAYNYARQKTCAPFRVVLHMDETTECIPFIEGVGRAVPGKKY